jgi:hypothetical protein
MATRKKAASEEAASSGCVWEDFRDQLMGLKTSRLLKFFLHHQ